MIQNQTILKVTDNSGAKIVKCIKVLGGFKRNYAVLGDVILVSVQELRNKSKETSKVLKGEIYKAIVLRTKRSIKKKDGSVFFFFDNAVCLLNKKKIPLATRVLGPVSKKLKKKRFSKLLSISSGIF